MKHWTQDRRARCFTCSPKRCQCGPFCVHCGDMLNHYIGRKTPERCLSCWHASPGDYAPRKVAPDRRQAAVYWSRRLGATEARRASLVALVGRIMAMYDRNKIAGMSATDATAKAAAGLPGDWLLARLEIAAFVDRFGLDWPLLIDGFALARVAARGRD